MAYASRVPALRKHRALSPLRWPPYSGDCNPVWCLQKGSAFVWGLLLFWARQPHNQSFQFVPGLTSLHQAAFSPLRYTKVAAEYWRFI
jgi:hypothetical protein